MGVRKFVLGKEFQVALNEIKEIRLKTAKIQKECWEMIKRLRPKFERLEIKINLLLKNRGSD